MHGKYSVSVFPYRVLCDSRLKKNNKKLNKALKKFKKSLYAVNVDSKKSELVERIARLCSLSFPLCVYF